MVLIPNELLDTVVVVVVEPNKPDPVLLLPNNPLPELLFVVEPNRPPETVLLVVAPNNPPEDELPNIPPEDVVVIVNAPPEPNIPPEPVVTLKLMASSEFETDVTGFWSSICLETD